MTRTELGNLLNVEEDFIPEGKKNRPRTPNSLKYITIHNTDNTNVGADARAHSKFVKNTGHYINDKGEKIWVSWHYTVDDGRVVKHLPLNEGCYHTFNGGNQQSIAIEICMNQGIDQEAAFLRAARLVAALLYDLKKSSDSIVPHYFWTKKNCPRLLLNNGKPGAQWKNFITLIETVYASIDS